MAKLEDLVVHLRGDVSNLQKALGQAESKISGLESTTKQKTSQISGHFRNLGSVVATYFGVQTVQAIGSVAIQMEALQAKMEAAVGSVELAGEAIAFIRSESERLGLSFLDAGGAFAGFAASAMRAGLTFDETKNIFVGVAEAASAMKLSVADQSLVFKALEQMVSKGTVSMEELRGQLGERLPGAVQLFAAAMGVTSAEFLKMVENGEIGTESLKKFGAALSTEFGQNAVSAAQSAQAQINRFKNSLNELYVTLANSGGMKLFIGVLDLAKAAVKGLQIQFAYLKNFVVGAGEQITAVAGNIYNAYAKAYNSVATLSNKLGADMELMETKQVMRQEELAAISKKRLDDEINGIVNATKAQKELNKAQTEVKTQQKEKEKTTGGKVKVTSTLEDDVPKSAKKAADAVKKVTEETERSLDSLNSAALGSIRTFDDLKNVAMNALGEIASEWGKSLFSSKGKSSGGAAGGGIFNDLFSSIGSSIGGLFGRAAGGSVSPNTPYMVGERGPEMFVPNVGGQIMNQGQMGGGGQSIVVNQSINLSTGVTQTVRAELMQALPQINSMTKASVLEAINGGGNMSKAVGRRT